VRKTSAGLISLALAAGLGATFGAPAVVAAPTTHKVQADPSLAHGDELPNAQEEKRRALREQALTTLLNGEGKVQQRGASTVMKVGEATTARAVTRSGKLKAKRSSTDQYVELAREKTDKIFVVLAEFGNQRHPSYPDRDTDPATPGPVVFDGPLHNAIPEPDRTVDNSTVWQPDYDRAHYDDLYFGEGARPGAGRDFESVKTYYERQSSGRYSVEGLVTDWVRVPFNEARYGRSGGFPCASNVCSNTWFLIRDALDQWVADRRAAGATDAQIRAELQSFDVWDRYDHDADGNFNEPDGYIDHFQIVHAGGDEADGDPWQGEDAIWSHRWKAFQGTGQGPAGNPDGGVQIGQTGLWVADYTIQPENGGLSVFTHEYGHDLGLPDLYHRAGTGDAENSVNWWSLMAQSRVDGPRDVGLGQRSADLGAWEKLQLGWLDYEIMLPSQNRRLWLGPHEFNSNRAQAAVVVLPKKKVTFDLAAPFAGAQSWWSDTGDGYEATMARQVTLPAGAAAALQFQANVNIEDCGPDPCDYAYVEVDPGTGWVAIPGNITKSAEGNGIDGDSGGWVPATFDLTPYAGQTIGLRVRYTTDGAAQGQNPDKAPGIFLDNVRVTSGTTTVFESGAESSPEGWTLDGFRAVGATETIEFDNYYVASHRDYVSFDRYLRSGPYNFGFAPQRPDWIERFPYQDGLLISYWDTSQSDNDTSLHPGEGEILPVDANPAPRVRLDGGYWRPRVAGYDATFSLEKSDSFFLHFNGQRNYLRGPAARPLFNDSRQFWFPETPSAGVDVPDNRVNIRVQDQRGTSMRIRVWER
jgi:immune inhibitor A